MGTAVIFTPNLQKTKVKSLKEVLDEPGLSRTVPPTPNNLDLEIPTGPPFCWVGLMPEWDSQMLWLSMGLYG